MTTTTPTIDVRRAADRFHTSIGWLESHHSFSFADHYDPANVGHGLLIVHNDDIVRAGTGFGTHPHRDMEIVTWVLSGELEHRDSEGNHGIIYPGLAQRMSAGRGIRHSEMNQSADTDVHLVQMWVLPDTRGIAPGYEQLDINDALASGDLVPIATGTPADGAVTIHQRDAVLLGARLAADARVEVPDAPHVHVFVATGDAELDGAGALASGDAVRLTGAGTRALVAGPQGAELLVWATA
jgi:hypothetical protein